MLAFGDLRAITLLKHGKSVFRTACPEMDVGQVDATDRLLRGVAVLDHCLEITLCVAQGLIAHFGIRVVQQAQIRLACG
ncbi:MAG: hypothetical protein U0992_08295 [Planctomycetaceae bacterium]